MNRRIIGIVLTMMMLALFSHGQAWAADPTITGVSPSSGPLAGGTTVTVTGTDLSSCINFYFGANLVSGARGGNTQMTVTSPAGAAGTVDVTCDYSSGFGPGRTATSVADQFTYNTLPSVTSLSPKVGVIAGGTAVTITGSQFTGANGVMFGGVAGAITSQSATSITATAPVGAAGSVVDVTVTSLAGNSAIHAGDKYSYGDPVTITGISPPIGSAAGGYTVIITGTNFPASLNSNFGSVNASFTRNSGTQITALIYASPAGTYDLQLLSPFGNSVSTAASTFTLVAQPAITGISPSTGFTTGGTSVTITGTGFTGATAVTFGAAAATSFTVNSDSQITATSPPAPYGANTYPVSVTVPVGGDSAGVSVADFTYTTPPPTITSITPSSGTTDGGTTVTITGANFTGAVVSFGGTAATSVASVDDSHITAVSPAHAAGMVDITVTTPSGTSATGSADQFGYLTPPAIAFVRNEVDIDGVRYVISGAANGPVAGMVPVYIQGSRFTEVTAVKFGSSPAASFFVYSNNQMEAYAPAGLEGTVDITLVTPFVQSSVSPADQFTYTAAPVVTATSNSYSGRLLNKTAKGPLGGGTSVIITGFNFTEATEVTFGGVAATFTVNSDTRITADSPPHAAGVVDVIVTTPSESSLIRGLTFW